MNSDWSAVSRIIASGELIERAGLGRVVKCRECYISGGRLGRCLALLCLVGGREPFIDAALERRHLVSPANQPRCSSWPAVPES